MQTLVTDEDDAALARYIDDTSARVLIWGMDSPRGFAIFCHVDEPSGTVLLLRLALVQPGQGEGAAFLRALVDYAFEQLQANRIWLDTSADNLRAQKAYQRAGFKLEGRLRQHEFRPTTQLRDDVLLYGLMRDDLMPAQR
jgi:RimJ/RimL family protein N-acetyltransferase